MKTKFVKSTITVLALVILATSAGVASAANAAGAAGGGRGGASSSSSGGGLGESDNGWKDPTHNDEGRKTPRTEVRLYSDNCRWKKKQRSDGTTYYAFNFSGKCQVKSLQ